MREREREREKRKSRKREPGRMDGKGDFSFYKRSSGPALFMMARGGKAS
jgi:hypothetical protein